MDIKIAVDVASKGAEQFVDLYYKLHDTQRSRLGKFYRDSSLILWNGNPYTGAAALSDAIIRLPVSSHEVSALDCHPLLAAASPDGSSFPLLISVNGTVKYGDEVVPRCFSQQFTLQPDPLKPGNYFVANDCYRFV